MEGARERRPGIPSGFWWKVVPAFGGAALIAVFLPRTGDGGVVPPAGTLLLGAALIGLVTTAALYAALRVDLRLPVSVAAYAVLFNLLVAAVKFGLAPHEMYEVNQRSSSSRCSATTWSSSRRSPPSCSVSTARR